MKISILNFILIPHSTSVIPHLMRDPERNHLIYYIKNRKIKSLLANLILIALLPFSASAYSIQEYNKALPPNGVFLNDYSANFYTGFAPRSHDINDIHLQLGRGNQVRLTLTIDRETIQNYLYNLKKRYDTIQLLIDQKIITSTQNNHFELFRRVVESANILNIIYQFESNEISYDDFYNKSLELMIELNPNRMFPININLNQAIENWVPNLVSLDPSESDSLRPILEIANTLIPFRINRTTLNSDEQELILKIRDDYLRSKHSLDYPTFLLAIELFSKLTNDRYANAWECKGTQCDINTYEFTTMYPVGTLKSRQDDENGNNIPSFATTGVWKFHESNGSVDDIRMDKSYYGLAPKMNYQWRANGVHNPAVRTRKSVVPQLFDLFSEENPNNYSQLWVVSRGPVSHGCIRMAAGHIWELRNIFPSVDNDVVGLPFYLNNSKHFDIFDIDADGTPEVMGVEYFIDYRVGHEGLDTRDNKGLSGDLTRISFYERLYGKKNVFTFKDDGSVTFKSPQMSFFEGDRETTSPHNSSFSQTMTQAYNGTQFTNLKLYEQPYEQDKIQFYSINSTNGFGDEKFIQFFGRLADCMDKSTCAVDPLVSEIETRRE